MTEKQFQKWAPNALKILIASRERVLSGAKSPQLRLPGVLGAEILLASRLLNLDEEYRWTRAEIVMAHDRAIAGLRGG